MVFESLDFSFEGFVIIVLVVEVIFELGAESILGPKILFTGPGFDERNLLFLDEVNKDLEGSVKKNFEGFLIGRG